MDFNRKVGDVVGIKYLGMNGVIRQILIDFNVVMLNVSWWGMDGNRKSEWLQLDEISDSAFIPSDE